MIAPTKKVRAMLCMGVSELPDPLDDLTVEAKSAAHYALAPWCPAPVAELLRTYAKGCTELLQYKVQDSPPSPTSRPAGLTIENLRQEVRRLSDISEPPRPALAVPRVDLLSDTIAYDFQHGDQYERVSFSGRLERAVRDKPHAAWDVMATEVRQMLKRLPAPPSVDALARALWETDPEVVAFLDVVGEGTLERRERAAGIAWDRREPKGSRERSEERAMLVLDALKRGAS